MRNRQKAGLSIEDIRVYAGHIHNGVDVCVRPGFINGLSGLEGQALRRRKDDEMYADDETSQITTIVFDLGNTVIRFDHSISAKKIANLFKLDSNKIYDTFFDSEITRAFERGLSSPRQFHREASASLGMKLPYEDFVKIWNDIFWEDEGACRLVRDLKKKQYKLFLLSNINRLHFEYIEKSFDIIKVFDELILSFVVGATKPDKRIYDEVIRRAGGNKESLLYIDDREDLIKEAAALGIDSIKFENADKLESMLRYKKVI